MTNALDKTCVVSDGTGMLDNTVNSDEAIGVSTNAVFDKTCEELNSDGAVGVSVNAGVLDKTCEADGAVGV